MSINVRAVLHRDAVFTDDEGREFDLPVVTEHVDDYHGPLVSDLPNGNVLVSYMVYDDDAYHLNPAEECSGWRQFTILDSQRDADELSAQLNDCESCGYGYADHLDADGNPRDDLEDWLGCDGWSEPEALTALKAGRAFLFEKYEHGLVNYALRGESSQVDRQWDVTPIAGFMWADDEWGEGVDLEAAARGFLRAYTDWCNGNVWGVVHQEYMVHEGEWSALADDETCWGYIGDDHAADVMKEEHEWRLSN